MLAKPMTLRKRYDLAIAHWVLTGGGDAPGLNPVIRAIVKAAVNVGAEVVGLEASFDGLLVDDKCRGLTPADVRGILRLGGTILGTTRGGDVAHRARTRALFRRLRSGSNTSGSL